MTEGKGLVLSSIVTTFQKKKKREREPEAVTFRHSERRRTPLSVDHETLIGIKRPSLFGIFVK